MGRPKGAENKDKSWRHAIRAAVNELRKDEDSSLLGVVFEVLLFALTPARIRATVQPAS